MSTTRLDDATTALSDTINIARHDDVDPAGLSALVGGLRELFWHTHTLTGTLAAAYNDLGDVGHDDGDNPPVAVAAIVAGLHDVAEQLDQIDRTLAGVHNVAAKLHHRH